MQTRDGKVPGFAFFDRKNLTAETRRRGENKKSYRGLTRMTLIGKDRTIGTRKGQKTLSDNSFTGIELDLDDAWFTGHIICNWIGIPHLMIPERLWVEIGPRGTRKDHMNNSRSKVNRLVGIDGLKTVRSTS
jgi:hypothetical protein